MTLDPNDPENVRRRPGMYVGDVHDGSGLHHLLWELVANCIDQNLVGELTRIAVTLTERGELVVEDDGPGISLAVGPDGRTFLERVVTEMHLTATVDGHKPHLHLAPHGVGLAAVCAVCAEMQVVVSNDDGQFEQRFARGRARGGLQRVGDAPRRGTRITLLPDTEIFSRPEWDPTRIDRRLREVALLSSGLETSLEVERTAWGPAEDLGALVDHISVGRPLHPDVILCAADDGPMRARIGLRWCEPRDYPLGNIETFCNLQPTREGGSHLRGFERGVAEAFAPVDLADDAASGWRERFAALSDGLYAVVSVTLIDPSFGGPTRDKLITPAAGELVRRAIELNLPAALDRDIALRDVLTRHLVTQTDG